MLRNKSSSDNQRCTGCTHCGIR